MLISTFFTKIFVWYIILFIWFFDYWFILEQGKFYKRSISIIKSSKCNISLNGILYIFKQRCNQFCLDNIDTLFIQFWHSTSVIVWLFVWPTVLEFGVYGGCHPCFTNICLSLLKIIRKCKERVLFWLKHLLRNLSIYFYYCYIDWFNKE